MFQSICKPLSFFSALFALTSGIAQAQLTLTSGLNLTQSGNLLQNGSFETGITSGQSFYWATGTTGTPFAVPPGWTSIGGTAAYAQWQAGAGNVIGSAPLPDGIAGLYFGNYYASSISSTPIFNTNGIVTFTSAPTIIPFNSSYNPAVKLTQTVTGLTPSATYGLSFWASGEGASFGGFDGDGIFGLDVTGCSRVYLAAPGGSSALGTGHVYDFTFVPTSSSITIDFTNWGHYSPSITMGWTLPDGTSELVLDNVILKIISVPEPGSTTLLIGIAVSGIGMLLRRRRK